MRDPAVRAGSDEFVILDERRFVAPLPAKLSSGRPGGRYRWSAENRRGGQGRHESSGGAPSRLASVFLFYHRIVAPSRAEIGLDLLLPRAPPRRLVTYRDANADIPRKDRDSVERDASKSNSRKGVLRLGRGPTGERNNRWSRICELRDFYDGEAARKRTKRRVLSDNHDRDIPLEPPINALKRSMVHALSLLRCRPESQGELTARGNWH